MKRACVPTFALGMITVLALAPSAVAVQGDDTAIVRAADPGDIPALGDSADRPVPMACTQVAANPQDDSADNFPSGAVDIDVLANDPSGVELTFVGQPEHGTTTISGPGTVTYTPDIRGNYTDSFTYAVSGCLLCSGNYCYEPDIGVATVTVDVYFIE